VFEVVVEVEVEVEVKFVAGSRQLQPAPGSSRQLGRLYLTYM
jgi:hypothetical protein